MARTTASTREGEAAYDAVVARFIEQTAEVIGADERGCEVARALNLMNGHYYLMETLGKNPDFDPELALETLLTIWGAVALSRGSGGADSAVAIEH